MIFPSRSWPPTLALCAWAWMLAMVDADAGSSRGDIEVGRPFPDLLLPSISEGSPASVRDFRGQKLVLHVFASW